jgi:hypothetical protein
MMRQLSSPSARRTSLMHWVKDSAFTVTPGHGFDHLFLVDDAAGVMKQIPQYIEAFRSELHETRRPR